MKYILVLIGLMLLVSCNNNVAEINKDENLEEFSTEWMGPEMIEQFEKDKKMQEEYEERRIFEPKEVELDAWYINENWPVDMRIYYSLDFDNNISMINVMAYSQDINDFDMEVQKLIWKNISEIETIELTWTEEQIEAFKNAFKN